MEEESDNESTLSHEEKNQVAVHLKPKQRLNHLDATTK